MRRSDLSARHADDHTDQYDAAPHHNDDDAARDHDDDPEQCDHHHNTGVHPPWRRVHGESAVLLAGVLLGPVLLTPPGKRSGGHRRYREPLDPLLAAGVNVWGI